MARRLFIYDKTKGEVVEIDRKIRTAGVAQWPYESDCLGVQPEQIPEAREAWRKHGGINMEFTPDGQAIVTGPQMLRKACKVMGLVDRRSYY